MSSTPAQIGTRIRRLRMARGYSQSEFARAVNVHPSTMNQIEQGRRLPKTNTISAMAHTLGVTRDEILDGAASQPGTTTSVRTSTGPPEPLDLPAIRAAVDAALAELAAAMFSAVTQWYETTHVQRESRGTRTPQTLRRRVD